MAKRKPSRRTTQQARKRAPRVQRVRVYEGVYRGEVRQHNTIEYDGKLWLFTTNYPTRAAVQKEIDVLKRRASEFVRVEVLVLRVPSLRGKKGAFRVYGRWYGRKPGQRYRFIGPRSPDSNPRLW